MNGSKNDSRYLYEFDGFRADPVRRRLSRGGEVVSLTPKAFSILLALLDKRGEVVPKEDLIQQIWPDTFVTEANLTQNISSLRKALGERANDPRLVVTVPGQGYTFVGDVLEIPRDSTGEMPAFVMPNLAEPGTGNLTPIALPVMPTVSETVETAELSKSSGTAERAASEPTPASQLSASAVTLTPPLLSPTALEVLSPSSLDDTAVRLRAETEAVLVVTPPGPRWGRRFRRSTAVGLVVLGLVATAVPSIYLARRRSLSAAPAAGALGRPERPSVAVLDFTNLSGNPAANWLTPAFAEMLRTELATGGKVRLISGDNTGAAAALALPEDANLRAEALKQLHSRLGADLIVYGTYLAIGESGHDRVRIDIKVLKTPSGEEVARLPELGTAADLIELVSRTGADLRQKLGWAPPSPAQQKEAQALRPANPEATRLYAEGLSQLRAFNPQGAKNLFTRASDADPKSAVIHSALAQSWADLGYDSRAASESEKAVQLSGLLAKQEQLAIQARFRESRREWKEASELYRTLWTFYPDDLEYGLRLANALSADGRGAEAQEAVAALRQLPAPKRDDPRIDLAEAWVARHAWDPERSLRAAKAAEIKGWKLGEEQVVAQALALEGQASQILGKLDDAIALFNQASALFAKSGNQAQVAAMLTATADTLDDQGKIFEARQKFESALTIAGHLGSDDLVATELANLGLLRVEAGELAQARDLLSQAAALFAKTEDRRLVVRTTYFLAQVCWQAGDVEGARQRYERVLADSRDLHSRIDEAVALEGLGQILARQGRLNDARRSQQEALKIAKEENDPYRTAGIVASLGDVTSGLGDLEGAERLYEQSLESRRRLGARLVAAQVQGSLAVLAYHRGDLAKSRELSLEEFRVAQQVGAGLTTAEALQNLGRTELAQADLSGARQHLERALQMATGLGGQLAAAAIRLDLARLELASGRGAAAVRWAREAADWYAKQGMPGSQAQALALIAEGFAREGQLAAAREPAEQARALSDRSEDGGVQVAVTISVARIDAAAGAMGSGPKAHLRWAVDQAGKIGLVPVGMEARLALGAVQLVSPVDRDAGRRSLEDLRREAAERGFKLIAQLAEAALATVPGTRIG